MQIHRPTNPGFRYNTGLDTFFNFSKKPGVVNSFFGFLSVSYCFPRRCTCPPRVHGIYLVSKTQKTLWRQNCFEIKKERKRFALAVLLAEKEGFEPFSFS